MKFRCRKVPTASAPWKLDIETDRRTVTLWFRTWSEARSVAIFYTRLPE